MKYILLAICATISFYHTSPMDNAKKTIEKRTCAICLNDLNQKSNAIISLSCNHTFDYSCLGPWGIEHTTCPLCRQDTVPQIVTSDDHINRLTLSFRALHFAYREEIESNHSNIANALEITTGLLNRIENMQQEVEIINAEKSQLALEKKILQKKIYSMKKKHERMDSLIHDQKQIMQNIKREFFSKKSKQS